MRPIDADALIEFFEHLIEKSILEDTKIHYALAIETVKAQPTIEPEVRRGRWIDWSMWGESRYQCSECNCEKKYKTNFCPKCGADMRGGADNG